jgi:hypothetical protein
MPDPAYSYRLRARPHATHAPALTLHPFDSTCPDPIGDRTVQELLGHSPREIFCAKLQIPAGSYLTG